jgi:RNA polymerase sigma factor (sigma-70 family)
VDLALKMPDIYNHKISGITIEQELPILINNCQNGIRSSQKELYTYFYSYAYAICFRYASTKEDTQDILNQGFLKVFNKLHLFKLKNHSILIDFKAWIKQIFINTAIDHLRKQKKETVGLDIDLLHNEYTLSPEMVTAKISYNEIMNCVQQLPPSYRMVFSLFVLDGFTHEEIAKKLGIAIGTSKSSLAKARMHLQRKLNQMYKVKEHE